MRGYELTERGKIVVAVLLVLLLLLIPSAILSLKAMSQPNAPSNNPSPDSSGASSPSGMPSIITDSPPPNGGGFTPPYVSPPNGNNNTGQASLSNSQSPDKPAGIGQPSIEVSEGKISFFFSPSLQNTLDVETSSLLDDFISSPKNAPDTLIAVEMPKLSDEDAEKLMSAVVSALAAQGIREQRLAYIVRSTEATGDVFEVNLYYIPNPIK